MTERYVIPERQEAEREFEVAARWWQFSPSFNVFPGRNVPVIRRHGGDIEGVMLRWGLIPDWAEADASKASVARVTSGTLAQSRAVRDAWASGRRCIVPMFGFYAWQLTGRRFRQPYFVRVVNRAVFGVAAVWDHSESEDGDDVIESCALITVPPNPLLAELEGVAYQMPAILQPQDYKAWLSGSPAAAKLVLRSYPEHRMLAHPVSPRINSLHYDDSQLIQAVAHYRAEQSARSGTRPH